jgi:PBSX family phage terminase large subunit
MSAAEVLSSSTPSFSQFDPSVIPYQARVLDDMRFNIDWSTGLQEFLLSGSVGSAKSILMAHMGLEHAWTFSGAKVGIFRQAMPDLRDTIFTKILEHIEGTVKEDGTLIKEGKDFGFTTNNCGIWLSNGSEFISRSWHDKKFKKLGSLELSAGIVEELTENDGDYWKAIEYIRMRVGRLPHIPISWIVYATNPDSPAHPAYEYFQIGARQGTTKTDKLEPRRHVYFSRTHDNPFLPKWYIESLENDLDPKMVRRMVYGEWVEISTEVVYHSYSDANYRETDYEVTPLEPIYINFDFNIGDGKPMSACFSQVLPTKDKDIAFHFFAESVVDGADTEELLEEMAARDLFEYDTDYIIHGDATGGSRSTKSKKTDYEIIKEFLSKYRRKSDGQRLDFKIDVPSANPPVRERHNRMNAYCRNALGKVRFFVYRKCKILNQGMRLTALKKGGQYVEDDSKRYQHVTTAAGYHVCRVHKHRHHTAHVRDTQIR